MATTYYILQNAGLPTNETIVIAVADGQTLSPEYARSGWSTLSTSTDPSVMAINGAYLTPWAASTYYRANQFVLNPSGYPASAKVSFTSGATYSASNWNEYSSGGSGSGVTSYQGRTGAVTLTKNDVTGTGVLGSDLGSPVDLTDATVTGSSGQLAVGVTSNVASGGSYTSPTLPGTVGTPAARFAIKVPASASSNVTFTYPNSAGTQVVESLLPGSARIYRQKSTSGWGVEAGNTETTALSGIFAPLTPRRPRNLGPNGSVVCASRPAHMGNAGKSPSGKNTGNSKSYHVATDDCTEIWLRYANWTIPTPPAGDVANTVPVVYSAALMIGSALIEGYANGQATATAGPGGDVWIGPFGVDFTKAQPFYVITHVDTSAIPAVSGTASTTSSTNQLTAVTGTFVNGQLVTGTGIPSGAYVVSGGGTATLTISANATASGSGVTLTGVQGQWVYTAATPDTSLGELIQTGTGLGDATRLNSGVTITNDNSSGCIRPEIILGNVKPTLAKPVITAVTDSIGNGSFDMLSAQTEGFVSRALEAAGLSWIWASRGQESIANLLMPTFDPKRKALLGYGTLCYDEQGINDFIANVPLPSWQANKVALWLQEVARCGPVVAQTYPPGQSGTSSDNWSTLSGQTVNAVDAKRVGMNEWVRGGAPMFPQASLVGSGTLTSGSPNVTAVSGYFTNGQAISGPGIPAGTVILSGAGANASTFVMSNPANASGTGVAITGVTTYAVVSGSGVVASGSNQVTGASATFANGQTITGLGIPVGTTIISGGGTATLTLSAAATSAATGASTLLSAGTLLIGQAGHPVVTFFEIADAVESARNSGKWQVPGVSGTGDTTINGFVINNVSNASAFPVGVFVVGAGIPTYATVKSVSGTSITLSAQMTATATGVALTTAHTIEGIHPDTALHTAMAAVIDPAVLRAHALSGT